MGKAMVKKVNIYAPIPVRTVNPPIFGNIEGISMSPANILKCLIGRATIYEVLSDGTKVKLNTTNYNQEHRPAKKYNTVPQNDAKKPKPAISDEDKNNETPAGIVLKQNENNDIKNDETPVALTDAYEDPELAKIAAEIAKMEAEEKANS